MAFGHGTQDAQKTMGVITLALVTSGHLTPADAVTARTVASTVMLGTAYVYAVPVSTTHVITSSVLGVGATRRLPAVRWGRGLLDRRGLVLLVERGQLRPARPKPLSLSVAVSGSRPGPGPGPAG